MTHKTTYYRIQFFNGGGYTYYKLQGDTLYWYMSDTMRQWHPINKDWAKTLLSSLEPIDDTEALLCTL